MGFAHAGRAWAFCVVILLTTQTTCRAETCTDLYKVYGEDYEVSYPKETIEVIQEYNYAEKYLVKYYNIAKCEYDTTELLERRKFLKKELAELESKLVSGYYLSLDEIRSLECDYVEIKERLVDINKSLKTYDPIKESIDVSSVPTKTQYDEAMVTKTRIDRQAEIGVIDDIKLPFDGRALLSDSNDNSITYAVANNTKVLALFNGEISSITDDTMSVDCYNGVIARFKGITSPMVAVGQYVKQYTPIGYSSNKVTVSLELHNNPVDISKILKRGV